MSGGAWLVQDQRSGRQSKLAAKWRDNQSRNKFLSGVKMYMLLPVDGICFWDVVCGRLCVCARSVTSVMSNSLQPYELCPARLLCPWNSPGKNTGVGGHSLLQGSSQTRDRTQGFCTAGRFFTEWATRKVLIYATRCYLSSMLRYGVQKWQIHW